MELEVYDAGEYIGYVIIEPDILKTQLIELIDTKLQDGTLVTILHVFGMDYGIVIKNQEIVNNIYNTLAGKSDEFKNTGPYIIGIDLASGKDEVGYFGE